ncbi:hypothetical protein [Fodinicola feengrottensis]|uniref:hypothetical protein n=1 Tax=Fodinicola feengrottensis TaxID=435914 RepID=UPI0024420176|nr:hypothetical protein [Fodinicola feengrottensis]
MVEQVVSRPAAEPVGPDAGEPSPRRMLVFAIVSIARCSWPPWTRRSWPPR